MADLDYTMLDNLTRETIAKGFQNQVYDEMPLFATLFGGAKAAKGPALIKSVVVGKNTAKGLVGGYGYVVTQQTNITRKATLYWSKYYYGSVSISKEELDDNSGTVGAEVLGDILEPKNEAAKMTLKEDVYADLLGETTAIGDLNTLAGMKCAIDTNNTYANINRSGTGNSAWQANRSDVSVTTANLTDPTHASYFPRLLTTDFLAAAHDKQPNLAVVPKALWEIYTHLVRNGHLQVQGNVADIGFNKVEHSVEDARQKKGKFEIIWDPYCPAYHLFMLTTSRWEAFITPGCNFEPVTLLGTGIWQRGQNQFAASMQYAFRGQILCTVPREQALRTALGDS